MPKTISITWVAVAVIAVIIVAFFYYNSGAIKPTVLNTPTEENSIPAITQNDISNGWYWGDENQKKPGTPADWIYQAGGRDSCWHKSGVACSY